MFVQVIEGRVADRETLRRQMERWESDVRAGAKGFLGSTAGVTDDDRAVVLARFESAEAARANSDRTEQSQWWEETEKCFTGDVTFSDSDDVDVLMAGGSNEAGFVQVMKGRGSRDRIRQMDQLFEEHAPSFRPDVIGGIRVWTAPDSYVQATYFTNEAAARQAESKEPPADLAEAMSEFQELMADVEFLDLRDPSLT
jgi:hypothetical protein